MGSSPIRVAKYVLLAQSEEHRSSKPKVVGSSPMRDAKIIIQFKIYVGLMELADMLVLETNATACEFKSRIPYQNYNYRKEDNHEVYRFCL